MLQFTPGSTFRTLFTTNSANGGSSAATIDQAIVRRNGTAEPSITPTVTSVATGLYALSFSIPSTWVTRDLVEVAVQATVAGVQEWLPIAAFHIFGDSPLAYGLANGSITPSAVGTVTGWLIAIGADGAPLASVVHTLTFVRPGEDHAGLSFSYTERTSASANNGLVQFTGLVPGATYRIKRASGHYFEFVAADSGDGTFQISDLAA